MRLYEKYRPKDWNEVIGQDKIVKRIKTMAGQDRLSGQSFFISGKSGQGKTTIALLLAREVASDSCITELDASELTPARLRDIEQEMAFYGLGKGGRAFIVNEAHGLRQDTIRQLLVLLERLPDHVVFVFTTTREGQENLFGETEDAHPLLSRCIELKLNTQGLADKFAGKAREIANKEGLNGQPESAYKRLANNTKSNFRAMLQAIASGEMLK